jgi:transcriptional regulator with XRE-family HTH domain
MSKTKQESPLRRARRARTLTQEQLANLVGISQETLSRAEHGAEVSRDLQELISTILGVPRQELFPSSEAVTL